MTYMHVLIRCKLGSTEEGLNQRGMELPPSFCYKSKDKFWSTQGTYYPEEFGVQEGDKEEVNQHTTIIWGPTKHNSVFQGFKRSNCLVHD